MVEKKVASDYAFYDLGGPIAVAHRGGDAAGAEKQNTLEAFDSASQRGFIYGETDVVVSPEGVPVISHDKLKKGEAAEVLSFEELLVTFPEMRFFVDVKTRGAAAPLVDLIQKLKTQDRLSLRGDDYKLTKDIIDYFGEQSAVCTCLGKLGQRALKNSIYIPALKSYIENSPATSFQMRHNKTSTKMIEVAHDLGKHVILWTPDTKEAIEAALDKGAYGVMSNKTEMLKDVILARDPGNQSIRQDK